ncbi:MAG: DnaB-like helicase N-terminal domain-containing protein, partial [Pseudomonadota bacterium]
MAGGVPAPDGQPGAGQSVAQPHNIEVEQALLGALLVQNDLYGQIDNLLQPAHFYDPV